jgi:hypothetical protein
MVSDAALQVANAVGDTITILRRVKITAPTPDPAYRKDTSVGKFGSRRMHAAIEIENETDYARPEEETKDEWGVLIRVPAVVIVSPDVLRKSGLGIKTDFNPTVRIPRKLLDDNDIRLTIEDRIEYKGVQYRIESPAEEMNFLDSSAEYAFVIRQV